MKSNRSLRIRVAYILVGAAVAIALLVIHGSSAETLPPVDRGANPPAASVTATATTSDASVDQSGNSTAPSDEKSAKTSDSNGDASTRDAQGTQSQVTNDGPSAPALVPQVMPMTMWTPSGLQDSSDALPTVSRNPNPGYNASQPTATPAPAPAPSNNSSTMHVPTDWSANHVVFSAPTSMAEQVKLAGNVRYQQQLARRATVSSVSPDAWRWQHAPLGPKTLTGDWNAYLGVDGTSGNAAAVAAYIYPAKFAFDPRAQSCFDYIAYPTGLTGSTAAVAARTIGTFSAEPITTGQTFTITNPNNTSSLTVTSDPTVNTGTFWAIDPSIANDATNLAAAINRNVGAVGVTATANSPGTGQVTITATGVAGALGNNLSVTNNVVDFNFPPTTAFLDGANTDTGTGGGQPTIVAYTNLYDTNVTSGSPCNGFDGPTVYWAYNTNTTGTLGPIATSPVLSLDGLQLAFVQNDSTKANLILLKYSANVGSITAPRQPTQVTAANYAACTAPCETVIPFTAGIGEVASLTDTNSSPFYDYNPGADTIYIGDDDGYLHKFTGVFLGTPTEVAAGGWPVAVTAVNSENTKLTSPVLDGYVGASGRVFVADGAGFLYAVDVASATPISTTGSGAISFVESPTLNVTQGAVYVYAAATGGGCSGGPTVLAYSTSFASGDGAAKGRQTVGAAGSCPQVLYAGAFDHAVLAGGAGHMYICGADVTGGSTNAAIPTLYQLGIGADGSLTGTNATGPALTSAALPFCSSVTEFYNNPGGGVTPADRIYLSVPGTAISGDAVVQCPVGNTGCIMAFDVTAGSAITSTTATSATASAPGGTSAIVVDNYVSSSGGSQVYYTPLSTTEAVCSSIGNIGVGGCAIQASQSGLN